MCSRLPGSGYLTGTSFLMKRRMASDSAVSVAGSDSSAASTAACSLSYSSFTGYRYMSLPVERRKLALFFIWAAVSVNFTSML